MSAHFQLSRSSLISFYVKTAKPKIYSKIPLSDYIPTQRIIWLPATKFLNFSPLKKLVAMPKFYRLLTKLLPLQAKWSAHDWLLSRILHSNINAALRLSFQHLLGMVINLAAVLRRLNRINCPLLTALSVCLHLLKMCKWRKKKKKRRTC